MFSCLCSNIYFYLSHAVKSKMRKKRLWTTYVRTTLTWTNTGKRLRLNCNPRKTKKVPFINFTDLHHNSNIDWTVFIIHKFQIDSFRLLECWTTNWNHGCTSYTRGKWWSSTHWQWVSFQSWFQQWSIFFNSHNDDTAEKITISDTDGELEPDDSPLYQNQEQDPEVTWMMFDWLISS